MLVIFQFILRFHGKMAMIGSSLTKIIKRMKVPMLRFVTQTDLLRNQQSNSVKVLTNILHRLFMKYLRIMYHIICHYQILNITRCAFFSKTGKSWHYVHPYNYHHIYFHHRRRKTEWDILKN